MAFKLKCFHCRVQIDNFFSEIFGVDNTQNIPLFRMENVLMGIVEALTLNKGFLKGTLLSFMCYML